MTAEHSGVGIFLKEFKDVPDVFILNNIGNGDVNAKYHHLILAYIRKVIFQPKILLVSESAVIFCRIYVAVENYVPHADYMDISAVERKINGAEAFFKGSLRF